jgi:hypothetical protein
MAADRRAAGPRAVSARRARSGRRRGVRASGGPSHDGRHHRDEREDDHELSPRVGRAGRRHASWGDRDDRRVDRRAPIAAAADHARGARPAAAARGDGRRRHRRRRDGGVVARAAAASGRRDPVPRGRVHEPVPGPPRLPRVDAGVLRGEGSAVPACGGGRRRREPRQRGGAPDRRARAADALVRARRGCRRPRDAGADRRGRHRVRRRRPVPDPVGAPRAVQRGELPRRVRDRQGARHRRGHRGSRDRGRRRGAGSHRGRRAGATVPGAGGLCAHAGGDPQRPPPGRSLEAASSSCSAAEATATGRNAR